MRLDENKALCNRIAEAINRKDRAALSQLMGAEMAASFEARMGELWGAFPDYHGGNLEQIAEGDTVVNRWEYTGTHQGELRGLPATGRSVVFRGVSIDRIVDGRVVSFYGLMDEAHVLRQLGVPLPE